MTVWKIHTKSGNDTCGNNWVAVHSLYNMIQFSGSPQDLQYNTFQLSDATPYSRERLHATGRRPGVYRYSAVNWSELNARVTSDLNERCARSGVIRSQTQIRRRPANSFWQRSCEQGMTTDILQGNVGYDLANDLLRELWTDSGSIFTVPSTPLIQAVIT